MAAGYYQVDATGYNNRKFKSVGSARKSAVAYARKHKNAMRFDGEFVAVLWFSPAGWGDTVGYVSLDYGGNPIWMDVNQHSYTHFVNADGSIRKRH